MELCLQDLTEIISNDDRHVCHLAKLLLRSGYVAEYAGGLDPSGVYVREITSLFISGLRTVPT
jgi:hypothetical protein